MTGGCPIETPTVSIIIPTFNGASRIGKCLDSLRTQDGGIETEILVVNDGSTDNTAEVVSRYPGVRLISQTNAGPAAARNRGALEARGTIILFTDDDCVPLANWVAAMVEPFKNLELAGVKGTYLTHQKSLVARFVQIEYEDRYRLMARSATIDFVDTYSAGFRRERFMELGGYDTAFTTACAEDIELSYRMSGRGWKMIFVPEAIVYHTHPASLWQYLKKKYKFAFWRVLAIRKNPSKAVKDSHTPQIMKLQLLLAPLLTMAVAYDLVVRPKVLASAVVLGMFLVSTLPFAWHAIREDRLVGVLSPLMLAGRACAQGLGVMAGLIHARRKVAKVATKSTA